MDIIASRKELRDFFFAKEVTQKVDLRYLASTGHYPTSQLLIQDTIIFTLLITLTRILLQRVVFAPVIQYFLSDKQPKKLSFKNEELETIYKARKLNLPDINEIKQLSTRLAVSIEDINRWFHQRQLQDRFEIKKKRCQEGLFRLVAYSICTAWAFFLLTDSKNVKQAEGPGNREYHLLQEPIYSLMFLFTKGDDHRPTFLEVSYFTKLQIPLYLHLTFNHVMEMSQRSVQPGFKWVFEFLEMLLHHCLVLFILLLSYMGNLLYLTTFCLFLHDSTDVLLEGSKLLSYFELPNVSVILFITLNIAWGYNRLYLFCKMVVLPLFLTSPDGRFWQYGMFGDAILGRVKQVFFGLIVVILLMNIYWFVLITRMNWRVFFVGISDEKKDRAMTDLSTDDDGSEIETETETDSEVECEEDKKQR